MPKYKLESTKKCFTLQLLNIGTVCRLLSLLFGAINYLNQNLAILFQLDFNVSFQIFNWHFLAIHVFTFLYFYIYSSMCEAERVNICLCMHIFFIFICTKLSVWMCIYACFSCMFYMSFFFPFFFLSLLFLLGQHTGANLAVTKFCILK